MPGVYTKAVNGSTAIFATEIYKIPCAAHDILSLTTFCAGDKSRQNLKILKSRQWFKQPAILLAVIESLIIAAKQFSVKTSRTISL
jgi:hypothetical protein